MTCPWCVTRSNWDWFLFNSLHVSLSTYNMCSVNKSMLITFRNNLPVRLEIILGLSRSDDLSQRWMTEKWCFRELKQLYKTQSCLFSTTLFIDSLCKNLNLTLCCITAPNWEKLMHTLTLLLMSVSHLKRSLSCFSATVIPSSTNYTQLSRDKYSTSK